MTWVVLSIVGTIAFAISGAIIGMEEDFDILGVYVLAYTTAFGGGAIRNLLIGIPVRNIWTQGHLFEYVFLATTITFLLANQLIRYWKKWGALFDAIGLAAFAIQGAIYAVQVHATISAVLAAATLTGAGGGMVRDIFAGRKPMIFRSEIYAAWAALAGLAVGLGWVNGTVSITILFVIIVLLRILSVHFKWRLPHRALRA